MAAVLMTWEDMKMLHLLETTEAVKNLRSWQKQREPQGWRWVQEGNPSRQSRHGILEGWTDPVQ